jgi:hypothetical protein
MVFAAMPAFNKSDLTGWMRQRTAEDLRSSMISSFDLPRNRVSHMGFRTEA